MGWTIPQIILTIAVGIEFFNDGDSSEKSQQRDAIVGRWDGHTLNSGGVGRMAAEHRSVVAAGVMSDEAAWRRPKK